MKIDIERVYDINGKDQPHQVLVDRLWPRGLKKEDAPFSEWCKEVAPSTDLRRWYGHDPERFDEFTRRYKQELKSSPAKEALGALRAQAAKDQLTLVTAARQLEISAARVLQEVLG